VTAVVRKKKKGPPFLFLAVALINARATCMHVHGT
jgi:hypothetical protein